MKITLVTGFPGSGKTQHIQAQYPGHLHIARQIGEKPEKLASRVKQAANDGATDIVVEAVMTKASTRRPLIQVADELGTGLHLDWLKTSIEDAQVNAIEAMFAAHGLVLPSPDELKAMGKDGTVIVPAALFRYRKQLEKPAKEEGYASITSSKFVRTERAFEGKAVILDYDGTLRHTKSGEKYPTNPNDVQGLPGRTEVLQAYLDKGYKLVGASNQSGVAKGSLSHEDADACFEETNRQIGHKVEYKYCPHRSAPISCYCRKPMPGMALYFMHKYGLNPRETIMVGDMTSDKTFAKRAGIEYVDQAEFFG